MTRAGFNRYLKQFPGYLLYVPEQVIVEIRSLEVVVVLQLEGSQVGLIDERVLEVEDDLVDKPVLLGLEVPCVLVLEQRIHLQTK